MAIHGEDLDREGPWGWLWQRKNMGCLEDGDPTETGLGRGKIGTAVWDSQSSGLHGEKEGMTT